MCGRYTLIDTNKLQERFQTANTLADLKPNYNAAPGQILPVVTANQDKNELRLMKWGLVPSWAKEPKIGYKMINARAEGIETKPSFRHAFKKQRCIVPANGFYEWQKTADGKTPKYIHFQQDTLFGFAGLWEHWQQPNGEDLQTYTIITTEPNQLMAPIHNRMPVILKHEHEDAWLDPNNQDAEFLRTLLKPYPSEPLESYTVSAEVNVAANNDQRLIGPVNSK